MQGQKTNGQKTQTSHQPLIISVNNGCHPYRLQTTVSGTLTHFSSTKYTLFETVSLTQLICFNQPFASAIAFTTTNIFMCMNTADTSGQNACTPWDLYLKCCFIIDCYSVVAIIQGHFVYADTDDVFALLQVHHLPSHPGEGSGSSSKQTEERQHFLHGCLH